MIGFFFGNLLFPSLCAHRTISATSVGSNPVWYLYAAAWSAPIAVYVSLLCSLLVGDIVISGGTNIVTAGAKLVPKLQRKRSVSDVGPIFWKQN